MILRNEYPRPQFKRFEFQSLNGEWNFDFDDDRKIFKRNSFMNLDLEKKIIVPFTYQTRLSGINDLSRHENMVYERVFDLDENLRGKNVILNFNAVDNICKVYLNGHFVGEHFDGYSAFKFDVSEYILDKDNHLVVYVNDNYDPTIPRGKQYWDGNSSRCWYNANSGIWQSVWLEAFGEDYIDVSFITPNIDTNSVKFIIESKYGIANEALIEIYYKEKKVRKLRIDFEGKEANVEVLLRADDYIDELHYWTVDNHTTFPVISLATDKTEEGTKINKSLTMSYRGKQNEILKIYGEKFTIEPFNDTMFKLTKMEEEGLAEEEIDLENTNNLTLNTFDNEF